MISEYVTSELGVYINETSRVNSTINVSQINVDNEVRISHLYDLEANLTVGRHHTQEDF